MDLQDLTFSVAESIATITLNRPTWATPLFRNTSRRC